MADKRSGEELNNLRERLYARGEAPRPHERTVLTPPASDIRPPSEAEIPPPPPIDVPPPEPEPDEELVPPRRLNYRKILLLTALGFFVLSILVSSAYMLLGRNTASDSNVAVNVTGPFTLGGGDVMDLQVGITNGNGVDIESATLVVEYPAGTRADDDSNRELYRERLPVDGRIAPGETRNVSLKSRMFGEENQEADIKVSVEYRLAGSSATLIKAAMPHRFKITHAPVTLRVEAEETISSGQETTVTLTVVSNSPTPITNLLVEAEYPGGFDFSSSDPSPVSGRNVWRIGELQPEASTTIEITGVVVGTKSDQHVMKFSVGVAGERDPNSIASLMAVADTAFTLEDPFLDIEIDINNDSGETVNIDPDDQATVFIDIENTLDTAIYDALIEVVLSGNALSGTDVRVNNGYYDSNTKTVRYDSTTVSGLRRLTPGSSERLSFTVTPRALAVETPQVVLNVSASARRVSETSAREEISGTHLRTIRFRTEPVISMTLVDAESGPVPPVVGQETTYEVLWRITNSANSISGVAVTAVLPSYVEWEGGKSGSGAWSYNPSTRTIEWQAGSVNAGSSQSGTFEVSILPSSSLAGRTPTLVEAAYMRSTDNFTGSLLRTSSEDITTELEGEKNSGIVQNN